MLSQALLIDFFRLVSPARRGLLTIYMTNLVRIGLNLPSVSYMEEYNVTQCDNGLTLLSGH